MVDKARGRPIRQEIPLPRTPQGAKPRWKIISQPRLSLVVEALKAAIANSDEGELSRKQKLEVLVDHAAKAAENVLLIRQELVDGMTENNKRVTKEIKEITASIDKLEKQAAPHWKTYTENATLIGMRPKDNASPHWEADEPKSLEVLAGELNLPDPSLAKPEDHDKKAGLVAAMAQGGLLTVGILGMKGISLDRLGTQPVMTTVMFALCVSVMYIFSLFFKSLYLASGDHVARWKRVSDGAVPAIALLFAAAGAGIIGYGMEAVIDGFGFLKIMKEESGLEAQQIPPGMIWLMGSFVSFPVLAYYAIKYFSIGYYRVFLNRLKAEQDKLRNAVDAKVLAKVREASRDLNPILEKLAKAKSKLESLEAEIRYDFNELELNRLEDLDEFSYSADMAIRQYAGFEDIGPKS